MTTSNTQNKSVRGPVKLLTIHSSGRSLALTDDKKIYLDFGIPGEEVTYLLHRKKQGFRSGEVVDVVIPSPARVKPFCLHYADCNSCPWMHMDYTRQIELKRSILCNALDKYDITVPEVPPVIPSPLLQRYRHRVEYTFARKDCYDDVLHEIITNQSALGFHKNGEPGQIIHIQECFLQLHPSRVICEFVYAYSIEHKLDFYDHQTKTGFLRSLSIRVNSDHDIMVVFGFNEDSIQDRGNLLTAVMKEFPGIVSMNWTIHPSHTHSQQQGIIHSIEGSSPYFYEKLDRFRFRISATSFFQPNPLQAEQIFRTIGEWADLKGDEHIVDLYTGIGTIAMFLASDAAHVIGIEGSPHAIKDALANAELNGISNAEFITGDILETFTGEFLRSHRKPDIIVLDPPRSGTLIEIKKTINNSGAAKVIYLSCNPVSLAFDLKQLTEVYKVIRIQPFDMLPHTHHLETLVLLERS